MGPFWSQHIYILEQNSSRAISNLQYVYSFMLSLKDFHILWVVYYIQQTTKKSLTMIQGKQIMPILCTAQTVWNKGLKKHWFPIVATYGTCIMGRWTCLWSGTCSIIIILHHKVTNDLISADLEIIPGGGGKLIFSGRQWGCLFVGNTYLRGKHLFEVVAYFIF